MLRLEFISVIRLHDLLRGQTEGEKIRQVGASLLSDQIRVQSSVIVEAHGFCRVRASN